MKCIAIDDEPLAIDLICSYASRVDDLDMVSTTNSPLEAISLLRDRKVDLIFLDIEMPNLTGLELVKSTPNLPQFIFTTAYPRYALDGFDLDAVDYLIKPIAFPRFVKAVSKARNLFDLKNQDNQEPSGASDDFIFVKSEYENVKINTRDITHIEGFKDYIKIHINGTPRYVLTLMSFKAIMAKLPSRRFLRIHRSFVVNIDYIASHQKNSLVVHGERLPVGETYKMDLISRLGV